MVKGTNKSVAPLKGALQEGVAEDDRYYCFVKSDGTTKEEWIEFFAKEGIPVEPSAKSVILSRDFETTSGEEYFIVIFNLNSLQKVSVTPGLNDLVVPTAEIACLLRKKLKGPELRAMRIERLAIAHKPIIGLGSLPRTLVVCCDAHEQRLSSLTDRGNGKLHGIDGIAYVIKPKKKNKNKGKKSL